jgi:hypothetical protein
MEGFLFPHLGPKLLKVLSLRFRAVLVKDMKDVCFERVTLGQTARTS